MNNLFKILLFITYLYINSLNIVQAKKINIAYIMPRDKNDTFFGIAAKFGKVVAKQLDMTLDVYEAKNNHMEVSKIIKSIIDVNKTGSGYDGVIYVNFKEQGQKVLEEIEKAKIPLIIENSGLLDKSLGSPREKFKFWIGEILPHDLNIGYELAKILISKSKIENKNVKELMAIEGMLATDASVQRTKGLKKALSEHPNIKLVQKIPGRWKYSKAKESTLGLMKRYPETSVIWTASDGMGLGVVDALKILNLTPGRDVFTGGIDWTKKGIEAVKKGEFIASGGGHFMEVGWALILFYDYLRGVDFKNEGLSIRSEMTLITKENVNSMSKILNEENWNKIDFKKFTKKFNKKYNFSPLAILKEIESKN